jgi:amino acid transporter
VANVAPAMSFYLGKTFGPTSAVTTALLAGIGYIIAMASVIAISGGFLQITLNHYLHVSIPWGILTVALTAGAVVIMIRGVAISTKVAGALFGFELLVLVLVSVASIISNAGHLSLSPFQPSHITNGFSGLAAGFPLAIYLFIGWENSAALAEETADPRRNVPRAVFLSVGVMSLSYLCSPTRRSPDSSTTSRPSAPRRSRSSPSRTARWAQSRCSRTWPD